MKLTLSAKLLYGFTVLVMCSGMHAPAQTQDKVVEWPQHPVGRITKVGDGMSLSQVIEALEIVDIAVKGKSISIGQPFVADATWFKTLTVRIKNISGQPISRVQMNFALPESRNEGKGMIGFWLSYGSVPDDLKRPIMPGEEAELGFEANRRQWLEERLAKRVPLPAIKKIWVGITSAVFLDGSHWASGCLKATKRESSCKRWAV